MGDPERPIAAPEFAKSSSANGRRPAACGRFAKVIAAGLFVVLLMLAWRLTPLAALTNPHTIQRWFADIAAAPAAPGDLLAVFVVGGLVRVPGHAADRGHTANSARGSGSPTPPPAPRASAMLTYGVGALIGRKAL